MSGVAGRTPRRPQRSGPTAVAYESVLCLLVCLAVEVGVRLLPLPRVAQLCGVALQSAAVPTDPPAVLPQWSRVRIETAWRLTTRWPVGPRGKCLRTSLVTGQRLRRLQPALVIGVRRDATGIGAHAWIVVGGGALDPSAELYSQLPLAAA